MTETVLLHSLALALRIAFLVTGAVSLASVLQRKPLKANVFAVCSSGLLIASSQVAMEGGETPILVVFFLALCFVVVVASLCLPSCSLSASFISSVTILLTIGAVLTAGIDWASTAQFVVYSLGGIAIAVILCIAVCRKLNYIAAMFFPLFGLALILFALPLIPGIGIEVGGGRSWIEVFGLSMQPSEFAKAVIVIAFAGFCSANKGRLGGFRRRALLPMGSIVLLCLSLALMQKDLGVALIVFALAAAALSSSTGRSGWKYSVVLVIVFLAFAYFAYSSFPHVQARIDLWANPGLNPESEGYQYAMACEAMARGGLIGTGIGFGGAANAVPVVESDYIICAVIEGLGLLGALLVVLCYVVIVVSAARLSSRFEHGSFEANLSLGLGVLLGLEAFINLGGVLNVIPMTGVTLPFVSSGGSSMVASMVSLVLLVGLDQVSSRRTEEDFVLEKNIFAPVVMAGPIVVALLICLLSVGQTQYANAGFLVFGKAERAVEKGSIVTRYGEVLATGGCDGQRDYRRGSFASHVVGAIDGVPGFAHATYYADKLTGSNEERFGGFIGNALALPLVGEDVVLTIDCDTQIAAERALEGESGAVVVLEAETGRVLALASSDPVDLANPQGGGSFLNRATQLLYAPGSTFKLVTLAASLEAGIITDSTVFDAPGRCTIGGGDVSNSGGVGYGSVDVATATNLSVNTVYGRVGVTLGRDRLTETASCFGFNGLGACDIPLATSVLDGATMDDWEIAWAAIGQPVSEAGPYATVMQMAQVMQVIANNGTMMSPTIVDSSELKAAKSVISVDTAQAIQSILKEGSEEGGDSDIVIYGKTGTAERGLDQDDSWYIGVGEGSGDAKAIIAIIIEGGGLGASSAMPKAQDILAAALFSKTCV